ncbi:MAG: alpha-L-fucosidase [Candidatus Hinthialibacter antarcticus]|nr:alpha-L-fucosidase [Candidatus Hinthialibacter antarcticus]
MRRIIFSLFVIILPLFTATALEPEVESRNKAEREEWFMDAGLGLFIHWSLDSQIGSVISHSMVGASEEYLNRYINELPQSFNPTKFDAEEWAILAKLAGFQYVMFTTKHHSGFCMFDTKTTPFNIMNTPYGDDVTADIVKAFRKHGIAVGFYYSPDDFYFLHQQGTPISRRRPGVAPHENPDLLKYDQAQLRELLTNYGPIDLLFLDGPVLGLTDLCWDLQPDTIITRGAMQTPEQHIPKQPIPGPWEACLTMGTQWQYKPTNEEYKSGTLSIEILIETRAKGGNLLYNIGPKPNGEIPEEQEALMRELALWNFVNEEAVFNIRPWVVTNEGDIWFTKKKDEDTVYAIVTKTPWKYGEKKTFSLKSVKATDETVVSVLGQNSEVLEYQPDVIPKTEWSQDEDGLHISAYRAQRLYNDKKWPNPVVLKITNAEAVE